MDARDARIAELEKENADLRSALKQAILRIGELEARVADLTARLGMNSKNSSKPPSSDPPSVKRPPSSPSGKKRGGQPGHEGHERRLIPEADVDEIVDFRPQQCHQCDAPLDGDDPQPQRWQYVELPEVRPEVTEYRCHTLECASCGAQTAGKLPPGTLLDGFGPRLASVTALLSGRYRLSKRLTQELLRDLFGIDMSLGAVCTLEREVSHAVAAPVEEARNAVRAAAIVHQDETGWREDKKRAWLWVAVSSVATVFQIVRSRGAQVARDMLGEEFAGHLVTDRWSAYDWVPATRRQICWAHLIRDFQGMVERGGAGGAFASAMLLEVEKMMGWWHLARDGTLSRHAFRRRMTPVRAAINGWLRCAQLCAESKTAGMCAEILKLEPAMWTFVDVEGVEPTNNSAERAIRPAVLWRKGSFGTDSAEGSRFVERILTVVATLRQHDRHVLDYLYSACTAYRNAAPYPSLLPS